MPELHDVEVYRRYLNRTGLHQRIEAVEVTESRVLQGVSEKRLRETLVGRELEKMKVSGRTAVYCPRCQKKGSEG